MRIRIGARLAITTGLAATAGLALGLAATPEQPALAGQAPGQQAIPHTATLLYNQDNYGTDTDIPSLYYGQGNTQNCQAADDFTVPKGQTWTITEVKVAGDNFGGVLATTSETVFFYQNTVKGKEDIPGKPIKKETLKGKSTKRGVGGANWFTISGITGVSLPAGHYWLSVRANMIASAATNHYEWAWAVRTRQNGSPAVWENPGNGWGEGEGCTTWTSLQTCEGPGPDLRFALYGSAG